MFSKKLLFAGLLSISLLLSGCGAEKTEQQTSEPNKTEQKEEKLTTEQVLTKAMEVSKEVKSFEMSMDADVTMDIDGETIDAKTSMVSQMNMDPLLIYQKMKMSAEQEGESLAMEMYMTKDELYVYSPEEDMWMKMPNEDGEMLELAQLQQEANISQQLESMKSYIDSFNLTEKEDVYELQFAGEGEELQKFIEEVALQNFNAEQVEFIQQSLDQFNIENLKYTYTLNKETFYPKTFIVDMTMTIEEDGSTMKMTQKMNSSFSKFNELNDLSIPEDVMNNAIELNLEDLEAAGI